MPRARGHLANLNCMMQSSGSNLQFKSSKAPRCRQVLKVHICQRSYRPALRQKKGSPPVRMPKSFVSGYLRCHH